MSTSNKLKIHQKNVISKISSTKVFQPYANISHESPLYRSLRRMRLGASEQADASNALGAYNSRNKLFLRKRAMASVLRAKRGNNRSISEYFPFQEDLFKDPEEEIITHASLQWGNFHEKFARSDLVEILTMKLIERRIWDDPGDWLAGGGYWINQEDDRYACSPDGIFYDEFNVMEPVYNKLAELYGLFGAEYSGEQKLWLVEYKCPYKCTKYDVIPNNHRCQLLAQMAATGIHRILYCVYVPGEPLDVWVAIFDRSEWERIKKESDLFLAWLEELDRLPATRFGAKLQIKLNSWLISDKQQSKCIFGFC